jgi:hypothetical protein
VVINAVTMTLGNVNDAALGMNALAIKDMRLTSSDLQGRVIYHYRQEVLRQLYRILGSADFIGNPIGLFTNVSSGVADIFYEPFNGVVHGNRDIGIGIAKGAASFVKKTVFGVTDSFTKITGSVGKGAMKCFAYKFQPNLTMKPRLIGGNDGFRVPASSSHEPAQEQATACHLRCHCGSGGLRIKYCQWHGRRPGKNALLKMASID